MLKVEVGTLPIDYSFLLRNVRAAQKARGASRGTVLYVGTSFTINRTFAHLVLQKST